MAFLVLSAVYNPENKPIPRTFAEQVDQFLLESMHIEIYGTGAYGEPDTDLIRST
jgi:hypothetical protein